MQEIAENINKISTFQAYAPRQKVTRVDRDKTCAFTLENKKISGDKHKPMRWIQSKQSVNKNANHNQILTWKLGDNDIITTNI